MKQANSGNKIHRNFKIAPALDKKLRAETARLKKKGITTANDTAILESALTEYLAVKH
jgi:hypothetical protein